MPESDIECVSIKLNSIVGESTAAMETAAPTSFGATKTTKTVGLSEETVRLGKALCTGWLLCTEGPMMGRSWELHPEVNHIGRADNSMGLVNVNLDKDPAISRGPQINITYDMSTATYYIFSDAAFNGIVTVNGKHVQHCIDPLQHGDIIKIGNTKLRFIPACDAGFHWVNEQPAK